MLISDEHITIRSFRGDDREQYCQILGDARVSGTLRGEVRPGSGLKLLSECSRDELDEKFEHSLNKKIEQKSCLFGVELNATSLLVGSIGSYEIDTERLGLSYWLSASSHGQGLGTRMLRLYCAVALQRFDRLKIIANVALDNPGSIAALRKAGFTDSAESEDPGFDLKEGRHFLEWMRTKPSGTDVKT